MKIDDFLCKDAFTMVNKKLAKTIWIGQAMLLSEMIYQRKKADNEVFEFSWTEMENELWVSPKTQQRYINELKKLWLISVEKWGLHNKNFFKINDEEIISVFPNGKSTPVKMTTVQKSKWPDSSYIYKKIYKKEDFEKLRENIPTSKWWDEEKGLKLFEEKMMKWISAEDMIKIATLDKLEIREKIKDVMFSQKKENWIRDFCSQSEEIMESRVINILRARYVRYLKWTKFKKDANTIADLWEIFWVEYINGLRKQIQKDYKEQN